MYRSDPGDFRGPPAPAQFAFRVATLGGIALVAFAIIFLRLWYLEVLSGDKYLAEAQNNQVREFTVQAPRGEILDRYGDPLVQNRAALQLQLKEEELPRSRERRADLLARVGELAGLNPHQVRKRIWAQRKEAPGTPVTLRQDVPYDTVYYLRENQGRFPGVAVQRVFVRRYPQGTLAAHLLGYVREIDSDQLEEPQFEALEPGDYIGSAGVESTYDSLLRGVNGAARVQVDASGTPTGRQFSEREPRTGNDLQLTIDSDVQEAGESALALRGLPGGFVAMNVKNGEILGLGSFPTYDPSVFAKPLIPPVVARQIFGDPDADPAATTGAPIFNRATQGLYPTGSTFKLVTALAALDNGNLTLGRTVADGGEVRYGGVTFQNAGGVAHGSVDLRRALQVSSDVFFYILGAEMNVQEGEGGALQQWAKALGLGTPTGLDVGQEGAGRVPTPEERNEQYRANTEAGSECGDEVCVEGGEITDRPWSVGDNVNLAVGQGDLQANPLQMAVAYAAVANGGDIVRPHVGMEVDDPQGRTIQEIQPAPRREVDIDPAWRRAILEGLHDAAMAPGGTSYPIFGGYPVDVAGKTGTAERPPHGDQSWYVGMAPYPNPKYVVAVTIEQGGFGADAAAPATLEIFNQLLDVNPQKIDSVEGEAAVAE